MEISDWLSSEVVRRAKLGKINVGGIVLEICGEEAEHQIISELNSRMLEALEEAKVGGLVIALPPRGASFEFDSDACFLTMNSALPANEQVFEKRKNKPRREDPQYRGGQIGL